MKKNDKKKPPIIILSVALIITLSLSGWFIYENILPSESIAIRTNIIDFKSPNGNWADDTSEKFPVQERWKNNSDGQPIRVLELKIEFTPEHYERNWFGMLRQVNSPFKGNIISLDITFRMGGQIFKLFLNNKSYQTEEYLSNTSQIKTSYSKEKNNEIPGYHSSDGILTINVNLEKCQPPLNYSKTLSIDIQTTFGEIPPGNYSGGPAPGYNLYSISGRAYIYYHFHKFNAIQ